MKILFPLLLCGLLLCVGGCLLPVPSRSTIVLGLRGRVLDRNTATAIPDVRVEQMLAPDFVKASISGNDGSFDIHPVGQWHWGRSVGLALNHRLPHEKRFLGEPVPLRLSHPDYESKELLILTPDWPQPIEQTPVPHRAIAATNHYLELGSIELHPKQ